MRWETGERGGHRLEDLRGARVLNTGGKGIECQDRKGGKRSRLRVDLGEALRESRGGAGSESGDSGCQPGARHGPGNPWPQGLLSSPLQRNPELRGHWKLSNSQNGPS